MTKNTPKRILAAALDLFNEHGESNVTTNRIADELDISPGNLHYHFRTKQDLVETLFEAFEGQMLELLSASHEPDADLEHIWLFLHLVFETTTRYRFIYRDLTDLCARYPGIARRFRAILKLSAGTARMLAEGLGNAGILRAEGAELEALVRNILLVSTCWLAFDSVYEDSGQARPDRAVWQVLSLVSPYLTGDAREQLLLLAQSYL